MFRNFRKNKTSGLLVLAVAAVTGTSAYAFTASSSDTHLSGRRMCKPLLRLPCPTSPTWTPT